MYTFAHLSIYQQGRLTIQLSRRKEALKRHPASTEMFTSVNFQASTLDHTIGEPTLGNTMKTGAVRDALSTYCNIDLAYESSAAVQPNFSGHKRKTLEYISIKSRKSVPSGNCPIP